MKLLPCACPYCGVMNSEADANDGTPGAPTPGSVMICETCGNFGVFVSPGLIRRVDDGDEWNQLINQPDVVKALVAIETMIAERKRK